MYISKQYRMIDYKLSYHFFKIILAETNNTIVEIKEIMILIKISKSILTPVKKGVITPKRNHPAEILLKYSASNCFCLMLHFVIFLPSFVFYPKQFLNRCQIY